jgi:signal transduction histidine kinase
MKQPDGLHIPIRMYVSRLMGNEGKKQGAIILFVDLSDIRNMEKQIRHLDTLAALGRFTSAVAHEIRNPLTGIAAGIQYLERKGGLTDEQRENISIILMEVDRLNRIITDLFKVAKPRDLLYQEVSVKGLIDRSYKSVMEILNNKRIEFETEIADNLPVIEVDHDQILQVFINLLKNAGEAVPEGGKVRMTAAEYVGGAPEVIRERDKTLVCFEISDNGPGIDRGDIGKIFEPFFSRKVGGTGLGLFISHNIVQHHQGRIDVSSKPGNGTSFKVYLPLKHPVKGGKVEAGNTSG